MNKEKLIQFINDIFKILSPITDTSLLELYRKLKDPTVTEEDFIEILNSSFIKPGLIKRTTILSINENETNTNSPAYLVPENVISTSLVKLNAIREEMKMDLQVKSEMFMEEEVNSNDLSFGSQNPKSLVNSFIFDISPPQSDFSNCDDNLSMLLNNDFKLLNKKIAPVGKKNVKAFNPLASIEKKLKTLIKNANCLISPKQEYKDLTLLKNKYDEITFSYMAGETIENISLKCLKDLDVFCTLLYTFLQKNGMNEMDQIVYILDEWIFAMYDVRYYQDLGCREVVDERKFEHFPNLEDKTFFNLKNLKALVKSQHDANLLCKFTHGNKKMFCYLNDFLKTLNSEEKSFLNKINLKTEKMKDGALSIFLSSSGKSKSVVQNILKKERGNFENGNSLVSALKDLYEDLNINISVISGYSILKQIDTLNQILEPRKLLIDKKHFRVGYLDLIIENTEGEYILAFTHALSYKRVECIAIKDKQEKSRMSNNYIDWEKRRELVAYIIIKLI
jgi:hypothetical protein